MKPYRNFLQVGVLVPILALSALSARSSMRSTSDSQDPAPAPRQAQGENRQLPLLGKITAIHDTSIDIVKLNGDAVTVKLTDKTEFRRDRQPAKRTDFKVGDLVGIRGDENPDHTWTAQMIGARAANAQGGGEGRGRGNGGGARGGIERETGILGKDYVVGEIKSIDAPKLSVLRSDNVVQTIELNEETSLRRGRDSITMADIQVGDHLFARGATQNNVFAPKMVTIIDPEQWKRMQDRMQEMGLTGPGAGPANKGAAQQKPPEPQH